MLVDLILPFWKMWKLTERSPDSPLGPVVYRNIFVYTFDLKINFLHKLDIHICSLSVIIAVLILHSPSFCLTI